MQCNNLYFQLFCRYLISQLETRKYSKDELVKNGLELKSEQGKTTCDEVHSRWSTLHQALMSRKTELTAMLEHADNLNSKVRI